MESSTTASVAPGTRISLNSLQPTLPSPCPRAATPAKKPWPEPPSGPTTSGFPPRRSSEASKPTRAK